MIGKKDRVVKAHWAENKEVTAWGGLALAERLAHRTRLWSDCRKMMPSRTRTDAGYDSTAVVSAMIHGLLSGSRGTYAAEPLREDMALRRLVGLEAGVPEEATVWRALGQWAEAGGAEALGRVQRRQCRRLIERTPIQAMRHGGFVPCFVDATWLEVGRRTKFEGAKTFDGATKLMLSTMWLGPYLVGQSFAAEGQGELTASLELIGPVWKELVKPMGLAEKVLFLADALYGNETGLKKFEACEGARYVVGAGGLADVQRVATEQPESQWENTGADERRGWAESATCVHLFQGLDWERPRTVVTRRYRLENEMFPRYASVLTNLEPADPRMVKLMRSERIDFARAVWRLYDHKQAMENQFKDALIDLGLHHPPCRELARNEVFYAVAALALNLAVGVRRIGLDRRGGAMRLWRLRRELFAIPARTAHHARRMRAQLYSTSNRLRSMFSAAMNRLASC